MVPATGSYLRAVGWESWRLFATFSALFFFFFFNDYYYHFSHPLLSDEVALSWAGEMQPLPRLLPLSQEGMEDFFNNPQSLLLMICVE